MRLTNVLLIIFILTMLFFAVIGIDRPVLEHARKLFAIGMDSLVVGYIIGYYLGKQALKKSQERWEEITDILRKEIKNEQHI